MTGLVLLAVASAAVSVATTGPGPAATGPGVVIPAPFTGFGGYDWLTHTTSIRARWTVPTIVDRRPDVSGSTWVGAESSIMPAFVQLGVTEQRPGSSSPEYAGFWSDTTRHFLAQPIGGPVRPGDVVDAAMTQTASGWILTLADVTGHWTRTVSTGYQGNGTFTEGEWIQEDPTTSLDAAVDVPYPVTTVVGFSDVRIDGGVPPLTIADAAALSAPDGVYLVPSAFTDDAFTLPPARGAARQYLVDAGRFDAVLQAQSAADARRHDRLSTAEKRTEVRQVLTAFARIEGSLHHQVWPAAAAAAVAGLLTASGPVVADYRRAEAAGFTASPALNRRVVSDYGAFHVAVDRLRTALGLPPV
ncbi:MAG: hypothetical protein ACRDY1_04580 [Acidimicrobiales bacterium]